MGANTKALRRRAAAMLAAVGCLGAGCASGATTADDAAPSIVTQASTPPAAKVAGAAPATAPGTTAAATTVPAPEPFVSVDVSIGPTSTVVAAPVAEPDAAIDPFGTFGACSALRQTGGNWSLQVSRPGQDVTAISILTGGDVGAPGTFDASFRVEFVNGAALAGTGTVTLEPGLQSGTFAAIDADLRGTFACTGTDVAPVPAGGAGVELFALLRKDAAERIVSLDEPYDPGGTECTQPGEVQVAGDGGLGAQIAIAVSGDTLAIRVGADELPIDPARTRVQVDGRAGSFHAVTTDGLEIDGAFTCS